MNEYAAHNRGRSDVDIFYRSNDNIILPKGKVYKRIHRWNWIETDCGGYAAFQKHPITGECVSLVEMDKDMTKIKIQLYNFENEFNITNERRIFFVAGEFFYYILLKHNGLVFHSSALDYNNNAILFSGPSGSGKSTHTSLWKKYYKDSTRIINDDTPALRIIDNQFYVFGTPWSGSTAINQNCVAPLRAIVFIEQNSDNAIRKLSGGQAFTRLLNETRKSVMPELLELSLDFIGKMVREVPIYQLSCNVSEEAVRMVKNELGL